MPNDVGIAFFGVGRMGSVHFNNLIRNPRALILYLIDADTERAREAVARYRMEDDISVLHPDNQEKALQDPRVQSAIVCTPTFTHAAIVKDAFKHGKSVFCEKPISQNIRDIEECYDAAETSGKPLMCGLNRRFDPSLSSLRSRVLQGEIGQIQMIKTTFRDWPKPALAFLETSGGFIRDCGIHEIDTICWILREYPCSVYVEAHAHDQNIKNIPDVDTVVIVMKFPSGVLATIDLSREAVYGFDNRFEVFGSKGMLICKNQSLDSTESSGSHGVVCSRLSNRSQQRYKEGIVQEMEHFLDVLEGETLTVTRDEVINLSKVIVACEESQSRNQPVAITWDR